MQFAAMELTGKVALDDCQVGAVLDLLVFCKAIALPAPFFFRYFLFDCHFSFILLFTVGEQEQVSTNNIR
jgi:hypothetical protein